MSMNQKEQYLKYEPYIKAEGLDTLINFMENSEYQIDVYDAVSGDVDIPFPPEPADLVRLHQIIRQRKCFTILEFGLGYSTIIMADALYKNEKDWATLPQKPKIRNRYMFQLFSVETSQDWIEDVKSRIPTHLANRVHIQHSEVKIGTFNGQLCHYYQNIPDVIADFIYLDGPFTKDVQGQINGLSFQCDERTVMAADLLLMESTFLPGTYILIDGRTNNARFLERNFKRKYETNWDRDGDVTTFELVEERLGKYNVLGFDFF